MYVVCSAKNWKLDNRNVYFYIMLYVLYFEMYYSSIVILPILLYYLNIENETNLLNELLKKETYI